ncbi:hypothetical protein HZA40_02295 [Candidatus Peregrinibacteria bacterium]|nr:hypothetical protein [Candidatus Peregrinibacteria bacterium]
MTKKTLTILVALIVVVIGTFIWNINAKTGENRLKLATLTKDNQAIVVASSTCGCCKLYAQYLGQQGFDVDLQQETIEKVSAFKDENKVPESLRSCHTTRIGNYIVEGHIPMEAIEKLLKEKPNIRGIGMAGMPSGSPGMPGPKAGPFVIDIITNDGKDGGLFMQI